MKIDYTKIRKNGKLLIDEAEPIKGKVVKMVYKDGKYHVRETIIDISTQQTN